ncbi:MAG: hypothetical protein K6347_08325 [Campylobacterales bacterium]
MSRWGEGGVDARVALLVVADELAGMRSSAQEGVFRCQVAAEGPGELRCLPQKEEWIKRTAGWGWCMRGLELLLHSWVMRIVGRWVRGAMECFS